MHYKCYYLSNDPLHKFKRKIFILWSFLPPKSLTKIHTSLSGVTQKKCRKKIKSIKQGTLLLHKYSRKLDFRILVVLHQYTNALNEIKN